jgi:hypothetical protein
MISRLLKQEKISYAALLTCDQLPTRFGVLAVQSWRILALWLINNVWLATINHQLMSTFVIKAMESLQTATGLRPTQRSIQQFKILTSQLVGTGKLTVCTITDMITQKKAKMQFTSRKFSAIQAFSNLNTCSQELIIKRRLAQPYRATLPAIRFKTFPFWAP